MLGESVLAFYFVEIGSPLLMPVKGILQASWPESYPGLSLVSTSFTRGVLALAGSAESYFLCGPEASTWVVRLAQLARLLLSHLPGPMFPLFDEDVGHFALGLTSTTTNTLQPYYWRLICK